MEATPLWGRLACVNLLIQAGSSTSTVDHYFSTCLIHAFREGVGVSETDQLAILDALQAAGANVNYRSENQSSPLLIASEQGSVTVVQWLIGHGALLDAVDYDGHNALMLAAAGGHGACCDMLMRAGIDPRARRFGGWNSASYSRIRHKTLADSLEAAIASLDEADALGKACVATQDNARLASHHAKSI